MVIIVASSIFFILLMLLLPLYRHCIAGRNFGCSITHDTLFVLFVKVDQMHVLLFKSFE